MPFAEDLPFAPRVSVESSGAIELLWLVYTSGKGAGTAQNLPASRSADIGEFWDDGETMLAELFVIAQQCGCGKGWDLQPLFDASHSTLDPAGAMELVSETDAHRVLIRDRIQRLADDPGLFERYRQLLKACWTDAAPLLGEVARPKADRIAQRWRGLLENRQSAVDLLDPEHIARTAPYISLVRRSQRDGTLKLTPCYLAGGARSGHIIALPGLVSVAFGVGGNDINGHRSEVERVASDLKLLSDPTRVLILTELELQSVADGGVGKIAQRVGISQPTASAHLRKLRSGGLINGRRKGGTTIYSVDRVRLRAAFQAAQDLLLPDDPPPPTSEPR